MTSFALITQQELADFSAARQRYGWRDQDFELQEYVFSPQKAEVEAALGEVGVRCLPAKPFRSITRSWIRVGRRLCCRSQAQRGRFGTVNASAKRMNQ